MPESLEIAFAGMPPMVAALLGLAASHCPDVRALIKQDMDLLDRLPAEQVERRANLQRVIDQRVETI